MTAPTELDNGALDRAYAHARQVTRQFAKSFYFCAQFLPAPKRNAIYAVYALCRHLDDLVDAAADRSASATRQLVEEWRVHLYEDHADAHPAILAWRDTATRYQIEPRLAEELMRGVLTDLDQNRFATYADLDVYCYRVASVVGLMTSRIFGYSDERALGYAEDLGRAMQLTNICRDVGEDARMGRIYLPADERARFGVAEESILAGRVDGPFVDLMRFQIDRARALYRAAEPGIELLDGDCRFTVRLSSRIYSLILDRIEQNGYDVLSRRAYVGVPTKLATLPAAWIETRRRAGHGLV